MTDADKTIADLQAEVATLTGRRAGLEEMLAKATRFDLGDAVVIRKTDGAVWWFIPFDSPESSIYSTIQDAFAAWQLHKARSGK